jgi:phosphatidylglycerophosphatase A
VPVRGDWRELWVVLVAFGAFRIFDVWKPPPCPQLEKLPEGWGILMDDLMAGVYANLLAQLATRTLMG